MGCIPSSLFCRDEPSPSNITSLSENLISDALSLSSPGDVCRAAAVSGTSLSENLISYALSLSSPGNVCRAAAVSKAFQSAADSDTLWNRFLPPDLDEILSRAVHPVAASSRKKLYFTLCDSILIRDSNSTADDPLQLVFSLWRSSGRKCYLMSAKTLEIRWSDDPKYWSWNYHPDSRFEMVAQLLKVWWLHIIGRISCRMLSPNTMYAAYLVFKLVDNETKGLAFPSQEVSVTLGDNVSKSAVCLDIAAGEVASKVLRLPRERADTWKEIEMGQFFNVTGDERTVTMILQQTRTMNEKRGLIIEGIEVRPKA